jgi:glucose-6-phosphate 1-epimerase
MESAATTSHRHLEIPGIAEIVEGNGGLPKVRITSPAAAGEIYLHGAHVTSWRPAGEEEVLFLSSKSRWEDGEAIRGGVPVCFPWFGPKEDDPKAPSHGLVRTKAWQLDSITQAGKDVIVSLFTESSEATKKWWPGDFRLLLRATFGAYLNIELATTNTGAATIRFEEALHGYFRVGSVEKARIRVPDTSHYIDKTDSYREKPQSGDIVISSETDRVYLNTRAEVTLEDPVWKRRIHIAKENSVDTVVWSPWAEKAHALADLQDEWTHMVCVEPSNVLRSAVELAPGQQHKLKAVIRVVDF